MKKETILFAIETENGIVKHIGKTSISRLASNKDQKGIKWFDDSKLLKK